MSYCKYTSANISYVMHKLFCSKRCRLTEAVYLFDGYNKDGDYAWTYILNSYNDGVYHITTKTPAICPPKRMVCEAIMVECV